MCVLILLVLLIYYGFAGVCLTAEAVPEDPR